MWRWLSTNASLGAIAILGAGLIFIGANIISNEANMMLARGIILFIIGAAFLSYFWRQL